MHELLLIIGFVIPQRSESSGSGSITMIPLPSECWERKVRYPAPCPGVLIPFIGWIERHLLAAESKNPRRI